MIASFTEVDLHGMDKDVAMDELEKFIQASFMKGENTIKIIHGRGEGILSEAVREKLKDHSLVDSFEPSVFPDELGAVTFAELAKRY